MSSQDGDSPPGRSARALGTLFEDGAVAKLELQATPELAGLIEMPKGDDPRIVQLAAEQIPLFSRWPITPTFVPETLLRAPVTSDDIGSYDARSWR